MNDLKFWPGKGVVLAASYLASVCGIPAKEEVFKMWLKEFGMERCLDIGAACRSALKSTSEGPVIFSDDDRVQLAYSAGFFEALWVVDTVMQNHESDLVG